jgi:uncharacterized protein (TIGR03083 family)
MDAKALAAAERADLLAFCRTLSDEDWLAPSLCEGWRVRDVAAHTYLIDSLGPLGTVTRFVQARFSVDRFNALGVKRWAQRPTADILAALERHTELTRLSSIGGGALALADVLVHHQDIRRPLHRPRAIPSDRLVCVLDNPDPFTGVAKRATDLRLEAADIGWTRGDGPLVRGPGEALVMAMAGRQVALDELEGDGVPILRERY